MGLSEVEIYCYYVEAAFLGSQRELSGSNWLHGLGVFPEPFGKNRSLWSMKVAVLGDLQDNKCKRSNDLRGTSTPFSKQGPGVSFRGVAKYAALRRIVEFT